MVAIVQNDRLPYARVYVPATHRAAFVVCQTVTVHMDGIKINITAKFAASRMSLLYSLLCINRKERSRLMYLAEVDLPESAMSLPSGLPAQVDLP